MTTTLPAPAEGTTIPTTIQHAPSVVRCGPTVSRDGTTPVDWAYDPGTGTWTEHPR